jgi:hypothetical protein
MFELGGSGDRPSGRRHVQLTAHGRSFAHAETALSHWWPKAELNHRHKDFQSAGVTRQTRRIDEFGVAGLDTAASVSRPAFFAKRRELCEQAQDHAPPRRRAREKVSEGIRGHSPLRSDSLMFNPNRRCSD